MGGSVARAGGAARRFDESLRRTSRQSDVAAALDDIRRRVAANRQAADRQRFDALASDPNAAGPSAFGPIGAARPPVAPPLAPIQDVYGGGGSILAAELAALGGGPDRASYLRPFDEAEARTRAAHGAAVPAITDAYAQLVERLKGNQGEMAATQARLSGEQGARLAQGQQQVAQLQAPVLADLGANFGPDTVGSLQGAVQAEAANQRAALAAQGTAQQGLAAELAAQSQRSGDTRIADSELGKQAALSNAQVNLNDILSQIGVQRAGAERQYANDLTAHQQAQAQAQIRAMREAQSAADPMDALNYQAKQLAVAKALRDLQPQGVDPLVALERQVKERQLRAALTPPGSSAAWRKAAASRAKRSPTTMSYFQALTDTNGNAQEAIAGLQADLAHWAEDKKGAGRYVVHQGKRIDPNVVRTWIKQFYGA